MLKELSLRLRGAERRREVEEREAELCEGIMEGVGCNGEDCGGRGSGRLLQY